MKIVVINKNTKLLNALAAVFTAAGHELIPVIAVNGANQWHSMDCLQPGTDSYNSIWYNDIDLVICPVYQADIQVYCGKQLILRDIVSGMADKKRAVCAVLKKERERAEAEFKGITSFLSIKELINLSLTAENIDAVLTKLVAAAQPAIKQYDGRPEVVRRREDQATRARVAQQRQEELRRNPSLWNEDDVEERRSSFRACY